MNASNRRHTRFSVPEGAFQNQRIKSAALLSGLTGWHECRVRDLSIAGALILSGKKFGIGDTIKLSLEPCAGEELRLQGTVVNCSTDHRTNLLRLGIALQTPSPNTEEEAFLLGLESKFPQAI